MDQSRNPYVWIALFGLIGFGAIGFWDDYAKVRSRNLGLTGAAASSRLQFWWRYHRRLSAGIARARSLLDGHERSLLQEFKPEPVIDALLGNPFTYPFAFVFFFLFIAFIVVGSSNAVNLTDGLDGLAVGLMIIAAGAMTVLTYISGPRRVRKVPGPGAPAGRGRADGVLRRR